MLVSLTVGKVDAGMAVLLTDDKRIIEFPSILLPPDISSGSIVDIAVSRNFSTESQDAKRFGSLQSSILQTFGARSPSSPVIRCRNATQTGVVLEWDPIDLATAELRSLSLYRNGSKAGSIPRPGELTSTKISGLAVDTEYEFQLVLRTSAGTYASEKLVVRTHAMTDLTGITVTPGIMPGSLRTSLQEDVARIGAKLVDTVRIDTTHFICTEPRGQAWERARDMNIPVVVPDWIKGCEREGRLVGVRQYYLDADPRHRQLGPSVVQTQQTQNAERRPSTPPQTPSTKVTPPTPEQPVPPPKDLPFRQSLDGATVAEDPAESSAATETFPEKKNQQTASTSEDDDDDEDEDSEEDENKPSRSPRVSSEPSPQAAKRATVEDGPEDESFQDVQL